VLAAAAFVAAVGLAGPLRAQVAEPPPAPAPVPEGDSQACGPAARTVPSPDGRGPRPQPGAGQDSPSDRLARTGGVICPPAEVDPAIRVPAPGGGATPVIPPPGTPGGDPSVQPK